MSAPTPLLAYLAHQIIRPVTKKGLFSDEYVLFGHYMPCAGFLYETGAILGYTFRDRLPSFVGLFTESGHEADAVAHIGDPAARRLAGLGEEPKDFTDLFWKPEAERLMKIMRDQGLTKCCGWSDFPAVAKQKMRLADIFSNLQVAAWEGIGFGSRYPELTQKLFAHAEDVEVWKEARAAGLDIPAAPPRRKAIWEREGEARAMIRPYIEKVRPDLLLNLGL